jgi:hypothetical protein
LALQKEFPQHSPDKTVRAGATAYGRFAAFERGAANHARPLAPEPAWFPAIGVESTISYIWRALYATDSYRGIALSGLMPAPPSIIQPGGVVRFKVLIVIAAEKPKGRLERRPLYYYSTISTMRRVRGSTKTVRPFTTV